MNSPIKHLRLAIIYILYLLLVLSLSANFLAYYAFNQKHFPKLHNKLKKNPVFSLLSPDTFSQSRNKILFVGDSYTQGAGDAYRDGIYDYSIAHLLARDKDVSVYNAGLGGHGNLAAAKNAIWLDKLFKLSFVQEDLPSFDKIVIFFYEGNDLNNNLKEYEIFDHPDSIQKIIRLSEPSFSDSIWYGYLAGLDMVDLNMGRIIDFSLDMFSSDTSKHDPINSDPEYKNEIHAGHSLWLAPPLQAAAVELNNNELDNTIQMFFNSILALKEYFKVEHLEIVYIPSPTTIYSRPEIIEIQSYENRKFFISSLENSNKSKLIRERIQNFARQHKITFADSTDKLIIEARNQLLHGPKDEKHLNKIGYEILYDYWIGESDLEFNQ